MGLLVLLNIVGRVGNVASHGGQRRASHCNELPAFQHLESCHDPYLTATTSSLTQVNMERRPTQSDVAKAAGVHRATVSLVFSNHPSIPATTKARVMECARKLGYSPDPMLSALAVYRSRHRPKSFQGTLAWLTNDLPGQTHWQDIKNSRDYYEGALSRAGTHGFQLEIFDLRKSAPSTARLASIFRTRNIQGLLLPPQLRPNMEIDFPWDQFSAVTFGHSLIRPKLHTLTSAQFRSTVQTMRQLKLMGYQRIGFFFSAQHDEKTDHNYLAGYLVETYTSKNKDHIPPLFASDSNPEEFKRWYEKYHPDAIITGNRDALEILHSLGISVPGDIGVASPLVLEQNSLLAGVYEDSFHIGEVAMDYLVSMIHRGERGIPNQQQRVYIEGTWHIGETLRQISDTGIRQTKATKAKSPLPPSTHSPV
jgi:LacI family transcriptional regulator/LacI family repressor for deo operon, udp, cdd, tsx, nupC, and nupG